MYIRKIGQITDDVNLVLQVKKDFEEAGIYIPIVVVDVDKCQTKENEIINKEKTEVTLEEFKENWNECKENVPERRNILNKINQLSKGIDVAIQEKEGEISNDEGR